MVTSYLEYYTIWISYKFILFVAITLFNVTIEELNGCKKTGAIYSLFENILNDIALFKTSFTSMVKKTCSADFSSCTPFESHLKLCSAEKRWSCYCWMFAIFYVQQSGLTSVYEHKLGNCLNTSCSILPFQHKFQVIWRFCGFSHDDAFSNTTRRRQTRTGLKSIATVYVYHRWRWGSITNAFVLPYILIYIYGSRL